MVFLRTPSVVDGNHRGFFMVHRQELRDKKRLVVFIVCFVGKHGLFFTEQGVCP